MAEIYLDNNATTLIADEVREAMLPWLTGDHGNPSCGHSMGKRAREAVDQARRELSEFFGCGRDEIVFTSGGSESNNLAIKGVAYRYADRGKRILIGAVEHASVSKAARFLERDGFTVDTIPVDGDGQITPDALAKVLTDDTLLVSVMTAQNVVGTINRLEDLAEVLRGRRIFLHTDAAQAVGKIPTAFGFLGADLMTVAGHKFYGPKGVGALIVRRGLELEPLIHGVGHESGRRAGTENVAGVVGLGAAVRLARRKMAESGERLVALRDGLHTLLAEGLSGVVLNGSKLDRLPNTLNVSFLGVRGVDIAERNPQLMLATGPACSDRSDKPSPSFAAMGLDVERARSSLRISLGRTNTWDEIEQVADSLIDTVTALRKGAQLGDAAKAASEAPLCPRCELHPLRLDTAGLAPSVVCAANPTCRYEAFLAEPAGAA